MVRKVIARLLLVAAAFAVAAPAQAADLTAKQIKGTISAMPEMTKLGKKYKLDDAGKRSGEDVSVNFEKDLATGMQRLRANGGYGEAKAIARKHGFSSPEQWVGVTARVMRAYIALSMGPQAAASRAQMKQSMAMIQNNPQFPAAQKQQMMAQMRSAMKMMDELDKVPAADKAAVKPHMAAMTEMMKSMPDSGMGGGGMGGPMGGGGRR